MAKAKSTVDDADTGAGETDETDEAAQEKDPADATLEDRLAHVEDILAALLTAHGETYVGALDHLDRLKGHIEKAR